jgi:DNA processing protein
MTHSSETDEKRHREYLFALASVEGIGAVRIKRLLTRFGSVERIFDAELVEIAQLPQFNPILASRILTVRNRFTELRQKLEELADQGIVVLFSEDIEYPTPLKSVPDAPIVLCRVGELSEVSEKCVAIVGTKRPTVESINVTLELSIRLVEAGFTIVSGLANGIDTNAHYGALGVNGTTIGVLSTDLSSIYPSENNELAMKIYETGCLFSEHPFPTPSTPANLVMRNRIISGLSMVTIVVETSKEGGAMHAARYAQLQDRPVFACQWNSQNQQSDGTRQLIRMGALPFLPDQLDTVVDTLMHPERLQNQITGTAAEQMALFDHQENEISSNL